MTATALEIRQAIAKGLTTVAAENAACRTHIKNANAELAAFEIIADEPARHSDPALPLAGIAVGVKDLYDTADMATSYGSPIFRDHIPDQDAVLVAQMRKIGAFVAGKTVTTEFAWRQAGRTVNPWNHAHTPGGSSSGSAAAVAAGLVPLAIGTQTFGSILRPAAFCGIVGFKPTYGLLPLTGVQPLSPTLDHAGLFARTVADISYLFGLLTAQTGPTPRNSPRLRLVRGPFWSEASEAQKRAVEEAAEHCAKSGATVTEKELPAGFDVATSAAETILCKEAAHIYGPLIEKHPGLVSTHIQDLVSRGIALSDDAFRSALSVREDLQRTFANEMIDYDAVLTLPALGEAPLLAEGTGDARPCITWTLLGLPAIAIPYAHGAGGLPLGLQLVGPMGQDGALLETAEWCEARGSRWLALPARYS